MQYVRTTAALVAPNLLSVTDGLDRYRLSILHTSLEQIPPRRVSHHAHDHNVYHVVLYIRGEGQFSYRGRPTDFSQGSLVFSSPGEAHNFYPLDGTAATYKELTFALEPWVGEKDEQRLREGGVLHDDRDLLAWPGHELLGYYTGAGLPEVEFPFNLTPRQTRVLENFLDRQVGALRSNDELVWYEAQFVTAEILRFLVREVYLPRHEAINREAVPSPVEDARRMIEERFRENLTIAELANAVHYSPGYFQRAFRKAYDTTPIAYQQELRLRAARQLLATSDRRIGDIAASLGFGDIYHFSRAFKQAEGISPRAYRKRLAEG